MCTFTQYPTNRTESRNSTKSGRITTLNVSTRLKTENHNSRINEAILFLEGKMQQNQNDPFAVNQQQGYPPKPTMHYCANCDHLLSEYGAVCKNCNEEVPQAWSSDAQQGWSPTSQQEWSSNTQYGGSTSIASGKLPRCLVCGYTGAFNKERTFHPLPFILAGILSLIMVANTYLVQYLVFPAFVFGVYLVVYCIVRIMKKKARICPHCASVEKFTYIY